MSDRVQNTEIGTLLHPSLYISESLSLYWAPSVRGSLSGERQSAIKINGDFIAPLSLLERSLNREPSLYWAPILSWRDPSPYWAPSFYWREPSLHWAPILYWEIPRPNGLPIGLPLSIGESPLSIGLPFSIETSLSLLGSLFLVERALSLLGSHSILTDPSLYWAPILLREPSF